MLGNFACSITLSMLCFFLNFPFKKKIFIKGIPFIRVANSLDPDQAGHFIRPDLSPNWAAPNCLQRLSADNMSPLGSAVVKCLTRD